MTTAQLYRKHKAGEIGRDRFLYEVRRDNKLPWVTNTTSYDDAVKILKNKGIISEIGIKELSPQTKYNAAMKAINTSWGSGNDSDASKKKAGKQAEKFLTNIDPLLKKAVEDFGNSLGYKTKIEKSTAGFEWEPIVRIAMGKDLANPEIKVTIQKDSDEIKGKLPDEASERRLYNLIKQIKKKELDVQLKKDEMSEIGSSFSEQSLNEVDQNVATDKAVDVVNPYFLKRGVNKLLSKEEELTNDSYIKALNKAAKALQKNPHAFDDEMFANNEDVKKADEKLEMEDVKKGNLNDKKNEMKKIKVKSLKESALEELTNSLKKKDELNEDAHWYHTVGSEVHTPEGPGTVKEIVGGTLTVELKDGQLKDYQINTIDHHTQKANEAEANPEPEKDEPSKDDVKDMWAKWDKEGHKTFGGMIGDPEQFKKPLDMDKIKQYMERFKDDKEKMGKLKEVLKKIKETKALVVPKTATGSQIDKIVAADPTIKPGQQIDILRK